MSQSEIPNSNVRPEVCPCSHPKAKLTPLFPARDFITGHEFSIARCAECGFVVTTPQPQGEAMAQYYPEGYYGTPGESRFPWWAERLQRALYAQRARRVEQAAGGARGRVLDVGCGRGLLLAAFRCRGWEAHGTELSDQAARYAREVVKVPVTTGSLETIGFPANHFQAITMWHVLEHVPDPRIVLAEAHRLLAPGGVLMIGVPNFGGLEARVCRDKWFHLDVPRHVTHLTRTDLQRALRAAGFQDCRWSGFAPEYDAFSFVQSTLNRLGFRHNLLYNVLRGKQAKVIAGKSTPLWQVLGTLLLAAPLGVLSLVATTTAGIALQGGTLTVVASKPPALLIRPS